LESYQQRVYKYTLATVKRQIQQAENPTLAVVISVEVVPVDNANFLDYLTTEVALEEPQIESTNSNIPIDNNFKCDALHFGMSGDIEDYEDEGDESDETDAIPTASRRWQPMTELERFGLGTSDVDRFEGEDSDNADEDEEASLIIMDHFRLWRTEGIVESVMSTGMRVRMVTMRMRRKKHHQPTMDQRRLWRIEGIVLECVKTGQYISDLKNSIMAKHMQRQAMYLN
jgi:hypothetical protein